METKRQHRNAVTGRSRGGCGNEFVGLRRERCRLDVYHSEDTNGFPTVVWLQGGVEKSGHELLLKFVRSIGETL